MPRTPRSPIFVVVAPGLEPVLRTELDALGLRPTMRTGGASLRVSTRELYAVNLNVRCATRVLVRVGEPGTRAATFGELRAAVRAVDWSPWLAPDAAVDVRATSQSSRLFHTGAVTERVLEVLDRPADGAGQRVQVRLVHDELTMSIDASGDALHRRGWRQATAKAPLRETIAAAMVLSSGWDRRSLFADPMCGSGTIAIEAALIAAGRAPGLARSFAFQRWPGFEPGTWASVLGEARNRIRPAAELHDLVVLGGDRDLGAVEAARANAARAGVADVVAFEQASLSDLPARSAATGASGARGSWIVTNPPYERRVRGASAGDRRDLFARIGQVARALDAHTHVGLLVDRDAPVRATGLDLNSRWRVSNGGIPVQFVTGEVAVEGTGTGDPAGEG